VKFSLIFVFVAGFASSSGFSHSDKKHKKKSNAEVPVEINENQENMKEPDTTSDPKSGFGEGRLAVLKEINEAYKENIRPIFKKACFNCHSNETKYPWYYKVPIIKEQIDSDIEEANKHLTMGDDFPFGGHGTPIEDLEAISKSIQEDTMPPFEYQVMHWESFLKEEEKNAIVLWAQEGAQELK